MRLPRHRVVRSALAFVLLLGVVGLLAQLAGVSGVGVEGTASIGTRLAFDQGHEAWLVQLPRHSAPSAGLGKAATRMGGRSGKVSAPLPGGWYEVRLGAAVSAAQAEAAFGTAGATAVEPVIDRVPYDETEPGNGGNTPPPTSLASSQGEAAAAPLRATRLAEQWALDQPNDVDIDGTDAWRIGTGTGAVIAVIDTGVDNTHPDLAGRVLAGRDFSGSGTGATTDKVGHGTQVASIIAANGTNMAGVAPDARILPLKVFRDSAGAFSMSGYLEAIRFAADNGANVINISLGCGGTQSCYSQAEQDAISYANGRGVLVVVAAGNGDGSGGLNNDSPETPDYPSGYDLPNIVSVTSSNQQGAWSSWSNYGAGNVDLAAPGEGILVAAPNGSYRSVRGTSFSSPFVAGTAALVASAHQGIAPDDLRGRLLASVTKADTLTTRSVSGGIVNARAALEVGATSAPSLPRVVAPIAIAPSSGARLAAPPTLTWRLPAGWRTDKVLIRRGTKIYDQKAAGTRRAMAHPAAAWLGGRYTWRVLAVGPQGQRASTPTRSYTVLPRLGAWISSGRLSDQGARVRLRIGYASNVARASTQITILHGSKVIHRGKAVTRVAHLRGVGSPRRAWFGYQARVTGTLRKGQRITVVVKVTDQTGGTLTRRFSARVA